MRYTKHSRGFTLTEILVVVGIIVLVMGISVPVFRVLSGNNSTGTARNQISAMLSLARGEALGLEQTTGVMFYIDPVSRRTAAVLVRETARPIAVGGATYTGAGSGVAGNLDVYLELVPNREVTLLPVGVSVQTFVNRRVEATTADRLLGFNTVAYNSNLIGGVRNDSLTPFGGVILFDRRGMITSKTYAFRTNRFVGTGSTASVEWSAMGELLYGVTSDAANVHHDVRPGNFANGDNNLASQIGFLLYESSTFDELFGATALPDTSVAGGAYGAATTNGTNEASEELWLDTNGLPNLIGRYNGTVIVAQ